MDISKFKDIFVLEVEDHLQNLNDKLLALEELVKKATAAKKAKGQEQEMMILLDELMRSAHTIKSSAATMGFTQMAFLTHVLEDIFDYARHGQLQLKPKIFERIFETLDLLEASLHKIKQEGVEKDVRAFTLRLKKITGVATQGVGPSPRSAQGVPRRVRQQEPSTESARRATEQIDYIKVPIGRLDALLDLTEELLIDRLRLESILQILLRHFRGTVPSSRSPLQDAIINRLKPTADHLGSLISNLQYQVMQARLVPVGQVFTRFPRMVRDLGQQQKKEINFVISGEDLELDRTIVDKLAEPIVHLLRNAVDHGVVKKGTIKLAAQRERDFVRIVVEDDGQGVQWVKVVDSAFKRGIIAQEERDAFLAELRNSAPGERKAEIGNLLFHAQLSTKEEVTETSGRGVGLSVVKRFVEDLGGAARVDSPLGESGGSRFILELPLTLAIINALLVRVEQESYAIPFGSMERAVRVPRENIKSMADQDVAIIDETRVPLVPLAKIFNLLPRGVAQAPEEKRVRRPKGQPSHKIPPGKAAGAKTVVLVKHGQETAGLVVDALLNEEEIIVKPLPAVLKGIEGFAGSTILGNGETILILDVLNLLHDSQRLTRT